MAETNTIETGHEDAATGPGPVHGSGTLAETEAEHKAFPPFDSSTYASQLLWLAITFGLLYYVMAKVALPRIGGILEVRRDRIASDLDSADRLRQESEEAEGAYQKALANARAKAFTIAETARQEAKTAADAQRAETEAALNAQLADAEKHIGEIKAKALSDVGAIAGDATEAIIALLTGSAIGRGEVDEAVTRSMAKK